MKLKWDVHVPYIPMLYLLVQYTEGFRVERTSRLTLGTNEVSFLHEEFKKIISMTLENGFFKAEFNKSRF